MRIIKKMRKQEALYWKREGLNEFGEPVYDYPVIAKVRWETQVGEYRNSRGETNTSKATVYVDREMFVGDVLKLIKTRSFGEQSKNVIIGIGSPEGHVQANPKRLYWDKEGKTQWYKKTGTGKTGWIEQFGGGSAEPQVLVGAVEMFVQYGDVIVGSGYPEGAVKAGPGKLYWDETNEVQHIKEEGFGATGWYEQFGGGSFTEVLPPVQAEPMEPSDPRGTFQAWEIQAFDEIPTLKANEYLYIAHL